jgi:hypothetical protein
VVPENAPADARISPLKPPGDEQVPITVDEPDEAAAPPEAVPLPAAPAGAAATVEIAFEGAAEVERLLPAIEAVTELLRERPGPLAVLLEVPVAGATRQIRLPQRVTWDDRLGDALRRVTDLPMVVALRPIASES